MKKEYIKPELQVCRMEQQLMLTSSERKELRYMEEELPEDDNDYMY